MTTSTTFTTELPARFVLLEKRGPSVAPLIPGPARAKPFLQQSQA